MNKARRRELTEEHAKQKVIEGETRNEEGMQLIWVCLSADRGPLSSRVLQTKCHLWRAREGPLADHPHALAS